MMFAFLKEALNKRVIPRIFEQLNSENDMDKMRWYEDQLIGVVIGLVAVIACIMNFAFRLYWQDPLGGNIATSAALLFFGIGIDHSAYKIKTYKLRSFAISACLVGILFTVAISYYERIGIIVWTVIFILILLSIVRLDKIMYVSVALASIGLSGYYYATKLNDVIVLNHLYYATQIGLLILILIIGIILNNVYLGRFRRIHQQYGELVEQKEEIGQLYEEITASEEELREQNTRLHTYNQEIRDHHKQLNFMAYNDELTGLGNRKMIIEKMQFLLELAETERCKYALVFLDINGLKKINDSLGHDVGDKYLKEVGQRFESIVGHGDTVGRFGGDEFAIILQNYDPDEVYEKVTEIRESFERMYKIESHQIYPTASFGVTLFPEDGQTVKDLIKSADAAMIKAKGSGTNAVQFYHEGLEAEILTKIELEQELKEAFTNEEFFLLYQPQVKINEEMMDGFEALIRWESPKRGIVPPLDFIPILEEMGLIYEVGDWVLQKACEKIIELKETGVTNVYISINVSGYQLKNDGYVARVKEMMDLYGIDPKNLQLELTESVFIEDLERTIEQISELKDMGLCIALDDFGTGYSSLNYLRRLPIDVLKIDKSFIWDLDKGEKERKIVGSIIDLVHDMDISVVAEGVETMYQKQYLENEQCDHIQGYLISRPLRDDKVYEFIEGHQYAKVKV